MSQVVQMQHVHLSYGRFSLHTGAVGLLGIWGIIATESEQQSKKQLEKYGNSDAVVNYQATTPLLLPVPKRAPRAADATVTMQVVPVPVKQAPAKAEAAYVAKKEVLSATDAGIKAAKAATVEDEQAVAAELVKGAIHRVLASLAAESDATTASSEDGGAEAEAKPRQGGGQKKKKKSGGKKGGKRK